MFPAAYDNDSVLLGDLADQKTLILSASCTNVDTTLYFESVIGVSVPTYLRIENELVYATAVNGNSLTVTRGAGAVAHAMGMAAFLVVVGDHFNILRDRAVETQKYQGLVGLDAAKPASPAVSEVYIATDTNKVYVCVVTGQWSLLGGATSHADVQREGETDDHAQYYNDARLTAWHDARTGQHVTSGDNHDHSVGGGAGRMATALSGSLPAKSVGHVRLATDTAEVFLSTGSGWVAITGAPSGSIVMLMEADAAAYGNACPPGWSRFVALDAKIPRGAPSGVTSPLSSGGALTHTHAYSQVPAHTHTVPAASVTTGNEGSHTHEFPFSTLATGTGLASSASASASSSTNTGNGGSHTHTFTFPQVTTGSSGGSASGTSGSVSSLPAYKEVIFCQKD